MRSQIANKFEIKKKDRMIKRRTKEGQKKDIWGQKKDIWKKKDKRRTKEGH